MCKDVILKGLRVGRGSSIDVCYSMGVYNNYTDLSIEAWVIRIGGMWLRGLGLRVRHF